MTKKRNAPALVKREGVECHLLPGGDNDANSTEALRVQFLARIGLGSSRAMAVATHMFGEARA